MPDHNPFAEIQDRFDKIEALLSELLQKQSAPPPGNEDGWLTVDEVATLLRVKKSTVYHLTHHRKIPFTKRGNRCYFQLSKINEWLEAGNMPLTERN